MNEERKIEIEEVEEASKPARARVETYKRKRDYLEGFLAEKSDEPEPAEPGGSKPLVRPPDEPGSPELPKRERGFSRASLQRWEGQASAGFPA